MVSEEPQLHDTVIVNGQMLRIVALSEDHGTKLSDGRWVCASKFVPVTRACWRYEPTSAKTFKPTLRESLAVVVDGSCFMGRDALGNLPIPREATALFVALTEAVERLEQRVTELEAR